MLNRYRIQISTGGYSSETLVDNGKFVTVRLDECTTLENIFKKLQNIRLFLPYVKFKDIIIKRSGKSFDIFEKDSGYRIIMLEPWSVHGGNRNVPKMELSLLGR
jgi:hypothetical protein